MSRSRVCAAAVPTSTRMACLVNWPASVWVGASAVTLEDLLRRLVRILERVQGPYLVTGSIARTAHGLHVKREASEVRRLTLFMNVIN